MTDSLMLYQQEDIYECAIALDRMTIKAYFYDKFFNVIPTQGYIFRTESIMLQHEMMCFGGAYTLLYNDLWKCTGGPICWVGKTENVKRNGSEENNTCSFAL